MISVDRSAGLADCLEQIVLQLDVADPEVVAVEETAAAAEMAAAARVDAAVRSVDRSVESEVVAAAASPAGPSAA